MCVCVCARALVYILTKEVLEVKRATYRLILTKEIAPLLQEKKTAWLVKMESLAKFRGPTSQGFPMTELNENGPPWLVSRPMSAGSPMPFGPRYAIDSRSLLAMS